MSQPAHVIEPPPPPPRRKGYRVEVVPSEPDPRAAAAVLRWLAARIKR